MASELAIIEKEVRDLLKDHELAIDAVGSAAGEVDRHKQQSLTKDEYGYIPQSGLENAQQGLASAKGQVSKVEGRLHICVTKLYVIKDSLRKDTNQLQNDRRQLGGSLGSHYITGEQATQRDIQRCDKLLQLINNALAKNRKTVRFFSTGGIEQKVNNELTSKNYVPRNTSYNLAKQTIDSLENDHYEANGRKDYLKPLLGLSGYMRQGDISEKLRLEQEDTGLDAVLKKQYGDPIQAYSYNKRLYTPQASSGNYSSRREYDK